jgi:hypothetical protein
MPGDTRLWGRVSVITLNPIAVWPVGDPRERQAQPLLSHAKNTKPGNLRHRKAA